jgi:hypothetical protein
MTGPLSPRWRGLRSTVFAVVAALMAALGHAIAGGGFPDAAALLSTAAVVGGSVSGLARRRRTAAGIFGVLLASQVAFHLTFVVAGHEHHAVDLTRMIGFHLAAAAIAALVMARGEAALFVLLSWLDRLVPTLVAAIPAPPGDRPRPSPPRPHPMANRAPLVPISRRGPPLFG